MALSQVQVLRNNYASAIRRGDAPEVIEDARQALAAANAERAIASWTALALTHRVRLAALLLGGDGGG